MDLIWYSHYSFQMWDVFFWILGWDGVFWGNSGETMGYHYPLVNVYIKLWKIIGKWWFYGKIIGTP